MSDTIAAIATASGVSSISIVRISGTDAKTIARQIAPKASFRPRYSDLVSLYNKSGEMIDYALVVYFQNPHSFSGEDTIEFQCHGGMIVVQEILESAMHYGARLAEPGEFSKRAFLNGKIDLCEAEAIAKLIEAKSLDAAKILARQLKGDLGEFVEQSREALLRALAYSEVMIDYAEEDMPSDILDQLMSQLETISNQMIQVVQSSHRRRGLIDGFRVAIIGKPNVGKSSLLNALLSYERAIVSEIAGTTRDTIEEQVRIGSHVIKMIDTAGIRDANDQIERIGIERSMRSVKESDVVIVLFDGSALFDNEDQKIMDILEENSDKEWIVAITKSDLDRTFDIRKLQPFSPIKISIKQQFQNLTNALEERLDSIGESDELMLVSARQIEAVERCYDEIKLSQNPLKNGELEFFSYHLKEAIKYISTITRPHENEEILDKIFGEFCLGK
ncbi:MAG: tRNA uridine-5-carboxymethylaminomethyl(34) synthesis GTPase MnmE [Sulfurovum sp.]|nr:tRNA uridine-5-carboxymethylaminomethyl(34) synthesis GTPase MnmE [Sulfurovum sp.]